ncbi:Na+/H+ antiporter NhaA [Emcibacter sp. SYSU 3D8]|uniref:Na+/H+ antiporter NhaA n=1 Tax=Emcibacter sp. SYSU 3D8 TaxID=3133969 RepID=UPI0031FEE2CF
MDPELKNLLKRGVDNIHGPYSNFVRAQTTASLFLLIATLVALWWANSAYAPAYHDLTHTPIGFFLGDLAFQASLKHIINDGLMVIFFFLLGLEIKREVLAGELARRDHRRMLIVCAVGGMVCPALIYSLFNWTLDSQIGWGIPMATDAAFALGVLTVVRKYIPHGLLAFIVGLAIVDDVGAILIIALFYTQEIYVVYLAIAFSLIMLLALANYAGVRRPIFYFFIGVAAWWAMLKSGVHPTVAGVAIALTVPARPKLAPVKLLEKAKSIINSMQRKPDGVDVLGSRRDHEKVLEVRDFAERASTPLRRWEDSLYFPVSLFILPLFALTNAGVAFELESFIDSLRHPVGMGITMGLVVGKCAGISGACWLSIRYKIGSLPDGINLKHVIGVSLIAGIGFTMSTFIAALGFEGRPEHLHVAKSAILFASGLSAVLGVLYLRLAATTKAQGQVS